MSVLLSIYSWLVNGLLILLWLPLLAVIRLFDRDPAHYMTGRWFRRLGAIMTRANPFWKIEVSGEMPENPRNPYVVVCNHQSMADIPIISLLPWEMKWVGKAELFRLPIIGWQMRLAGDIPLDRKDRRSRVSVLIRAREYLHNCCAVIFFPEGTRSRDGRVGAFNEGALGLAIKEGLPVLVLALDGTRDALPKSSWVFSQSGQIRLKVVGEIWPSQVEEADARSLTTQARGMIIDQIASWRGCLAEEVDGLRSNLSCAITLLLTVSALLVGGCDWGFPPDSGEDYVRPGQTRILSFEGTPNPIAQGDTMLLTVRIRDSLDTSFEYHWFFEGTIPVIVTDSNQVRWVADLQPGLYDHLVSVTNHDPARIAPSKQLVVEVVDR